MSKTFLGKLTVIVIIAGIFAVFFFGCKGKVDKSNGVFVTKWDNIYEGYNIKFYYEDSNSEYMKSLSSNYGLEDKIQDQKDDLSKALKIKEWVHETLKFDKGSLSGKEDAQSILETLKDTKKASDKDLSIVYAQALRSIGVQSRIGEFRVRDNQFEKNDGCFYVTEIWSKSNQKWIMIDIANNCYMEDNGVPLSTLEVINKGLRKVGFIGVTKPEKYISKMEKYFYSYTIPIDNTIVGIKKSNTFITYVHTKSDIELKSISSYIPATIFVNSDVLFKQSPEKEYKNDKSDKIASLVFMKKNSKEDKNENIAFVIGAFKNSGMLSEYYISINGSEFSKINKYSDITIKPGENKITLSEDGKNPVREVIIDYRKKK